MSAGKERPLRGAQVVAGMSMREIAAALGSSTGELSRWMALAELGQEEVDRRMAVATHALTTAAVILTLETPVPARGRVEPAFALCKAMTQNERGGFLTQIGIAEAKND